MSLSVIDSKLNAEVVKRMHDEAAKDTSRGLKELLDHVNGLVDSLPLARSDSETSESITRTDFIRENIFFGIDTIRHNSGMGDPAVIAMKYIPSYRIRYQSTNTNPVERSKKSGVWQFPECIIGTLIDRTKTSDSRVILAISRGAFVHYPHVYVHPFVHSGGSICTGTLSGTDTDKRIHSMTFIAGVYHYLKEVENIIVNGYHERAAPANGHLIETKFNKYKVAKSIDDEVDQLKREKIDEINAQGSAAKDHCQRMNNFFTTSSSQNNDGSRRGWE
jgi:hypothetical protein